MHLPSAAELIDVWERGTAQPWIARALTLLSAAYPDKNLGQFQALTIAERDRALMELRAGLFGPALACYTECPECGARLEFSLDIEDLLRRGASTAKPRTYELASDNFRVRFCAPDSEDLAALPCADAAVARQKLLERCVREVSRDDEAVSIAALPEELIEEISAALAQTESDADISLALACVSCAHSWELAFDIVSYLWSEISALAKRHLSEVHTLAWAYGWGEEDILAMSPARRQFYLERVENG